MEFLNAQTKYIAEQLRGMSFTQRAVVALLLVVLIGAMWGMISWSSQGEWTDLLNQTLTSEEIQRVEAQLTLAGVETKVEGDRVFIRGDENERRRIHSVLAQSNALPKDMSLGYAALVKEDNVWESDQKSRWKQSRALETELSAVVAGFHGISDARVLIVVPQRRIGRLASMSSASVNVKLGGGEILDKQRMMAIASYIAGAVPGLEARNVTITDGNRSYRAPDPSDTLATELLEKQRQQEEHYTRKIYDQLKHISGVVVNVHAQLRQNDEHRRAIKRGPTQVSKETNKTQESVAPSTAAGPGVRPNAGRKLADTGARATSTIEEGDTEYDGLRDEEQIDSNELRGTLEQLTASVNVPRSYLLRILETQQSDTAGASVAAIQKIAEMELPKIRDLVKPLIGATEAEDENLVVVDWYYDIAEEGAAAPVAAQAGVASLAKEYGPKVGLGLLAAFSLFMVLRVAKKAQVAMAEPGTAGSAATAGMEEGTEGPLETLVGGATVEGEVQEMGGVLIGHEVDESMIRTQQLVKQISQLVEEDPASAAGIVNHWLDEEK